MAIGSSAFSQAGRPPSSTATFSWPIKRISHQPRGAEWMPFWS
jgi:hypothetical protein